tara:strand:- start:2575 stop:2748 length:174 start_codon:yes stop_codon:yes gene_type:complete
MRFGRKLGRSLELALELALEAGLQRGLNLSSGSHLSWGDIRKFLNKTPAIQPVNLEF